MKALDELYEYLGRFYVESTTMCEKLVHAFAEIDERISAIEERQKEETLGKSNCQCQRRT